MTTVNTSTSAFFEQASMGIGGLRARAEKLQGQIGSGERLTKSSDDPLAASRMRGLMRADALSNIDATVVSRATVDLTATDSTLSDFAASIQRAQELTTQAASGTLTASQRAGIGVELDQIHQGLVSLANSHDSTGKALFGGDITGNAYQIDANGQATYIGTASKAELPIGEGVNINSGVTGPEFLSFEVGGKKTNLLNVMKDLATAMLDGAADPAAAANTARDALTALNTGLDAVTTSQTIVGSRLAWLDATNARRENLAEMRASEQSDLGGTDIASTVADLQQVMLVLDASQASFAKLSGLSLFNSLN